MAIKIQVNKPISIVNVQGATIPDGIAKIGNIKLEDDGTLTYAIHYYLNESDADAGGEPISFETFNMDMPNLENQIMVNAKTQPSLDAAMDI